MQKVSSCLWFNDQAEEAAKFYTSVFHNSKIDKIGYFGEEGPGASGSVMTLTFLLDGQEFMAINAGPQYQFSPAISLVVYCNDQPELDYYWDTLSEGGEKGVCGWLTDKYGVSWQIVPIVLRDLLTGREMHKTENVMHALLQMTKLEIAQLQAAYDQE